MNRFTKWLERRSDVATPSPDLLQLFSSGPTDSGQVVTPQTALSVPSVYACCSVLAQDIARCPLKLRQQTGPDSFIDAVDHPLWEILHDLSNPEQTAYQVKHALQWQLLTTGRAYAEIVRQDARVTALWPLVSEGMTVDRTPQRVKRWTYRAGADTYVWLFDASAPPILELVAESPILRCKEIIGTAIALQQFTAKYFANGARPSGMLMTPTGMTATQTQKMRDDWAAGYGGSANRGKVPVLTGDVKFTPLSSTNDDSQLNETQRIVNEQIAGSFRVPPTKIGDLTRANYANMQAAQLSYITDTLDPIFELWTEALRRDLLTARQFGAYDIVFDRAALARNDLAALNTSLQAGINAGYLSQNDCRRALGLNPIADGDVYRVNSALVPVGTPQEVPVVA